MELDEQTTYTGVSFVVAILTWAWGFWKNNDFTPEAREGTALMRQLKAAKHFSR